jgi:hypothetical protein
MAGSAGKHCGDATAPAMAASVPNLNTDTGAERFTAALVPWDITLTPVASHADRRLARYPAGAGRRMVPADTPTSPASLVAGRWASATATMWHRGGYNRIDVTSWRLQPRAAGGLAGEHEGRGTPGREVRNRAGNVPPHGTS